MLTCTFNHYSTAVAGRHSIKYPICGNTWSLGAIMVTSQKAYELAKSYSKDLGEVLPNIYFDVKASKEYDSCFYFDFIIVDKSGDTSKEPPMIGGAPGVIVDKLTGAIKTISFGELSKLK